MYEGSFARAAAEERPVVDRALRDVVRDESRVGSRVRTRDDDDVPRSGHRAQHRLDLAELDAEPADLHLVVDASEALEIAVRQASARDRRCGRRGPAEASTGSVDEARVRELRPIRYPCVTPSPPIAELADRATRHELAVRVEHVDLRAIDRTADRDAPRVVETLASVDHTVVSVGP